MNKQAISVTLRRENLLWLRGQARAIGARSVSEVLDQVITNARTGGCARPEMVRSVKGTIAISGNDPALLRADAAVRALFVTGRPVSRKLRVGSESRGGSRAAARRGV